MAWINTLSLTSLAMVAFAGNSLLCRLALGNTDIDPASFTFLRIVSGALTLAVLVGLRGGRWLRAGNWISAWALFAYAAGFSYAYTSLPAGAGALLLFGAVQASMIGYGFSRGERLQGRQWLGLALALFGLITLLAPGVSAPAFSGSLLMIGAGVAWGIYSLRGKGSTDPAGDTCGNFLRACPLATVVYLASYSQTSLDAWGIAYACMSGAVTSALGYMLWYTAVRQLTNTTAAIVQLSVPVIASLGGVLFLGESLTLRLSLATIATLAGIAMVLLGKPGKQPARQPSPEEPSTIVP